MAMQLIRYLFLGSVFHLVVILVEALTIRMPFCSNIVDVSSYVELKVAISQGKWARGPWSARYVLLNDVFVNCMINMHCIMYTIEVNCIYDSNVMKLQ